MSESVLLALDTATQYCSVALLSSDGAIVSETVEVGNRHAECILPMVASLLEKSGLSRSDIRIVAFGAGPGSFTGLRVACGVAQGLSWGLEIPIIAVNNLEAMALTFAQKTLLPQKVRVAVMNDARMKEIYFQIFDVQSGERRAIAVTEPLLLTPLDALCKAKECGVTFFIGSALGAYAEELAIPEGVQADPDLRVDIEVMAGLASTMEAAGQTTTPTLAAPFYIRNRVALTIEERRRGEKL